MSHYKLRCLDMGILRGAAREIHTLCVLPLPANLWGRDIMQHLGLILSNENAPSRGYSAKAKNIMAKMGYKEGKGLGHQEQGRIEPISPNGNQDRQGLGFP